MDNTITDIREALASADTVDVETATVEIPDSVGRGSVAVVRQDDQTIFFKQYDGSGDWYDSRQLHFNINADRWTGSELEGGAEYEYDALRRASEVAAATGKCVYIPSPIEFIPEHHAFLMEYVPGKNTRQFLRPFSTRYLRLRYTRETDFWTELVADLARVANAFHRASTHERDDTLDMCAYLARHQAIADERAIPDRLSDSLTRLSKYPTPSFPKVRVHGDFAPRNILCKSPGTYTLIDWNLSIIAHPFVDVHTITLILWRWSLFAPERFYFVTDLIDTFVETYLDLSDCSYYDYLFTKITALVRFYQWSIVNKDDTIATLVNTYMLERRILDEVERVLDEIRALEDSDATSAVCR